MKILGIIPSRFASTRFPGKPLIDVGGKTMIRRVYEQVASTSMLNKVIVATDHKEIEEHVKSFGGEVIMTSDKHPNGTSRCLEVLENIKGKFDVVINIQGDEPFISPEQIEKVCKVFKNKEAQIGTLVKRIETHEELDNPSVVKAIFTKEGEAIYFSRQVIPYVRDVLPSQWHEKFEFYKHVGIYGYRTDVLRVLPGLKESNLESAEKLEQLRWLEHGYSIHVDITDEESIGIDTPEDLERAIMKLKNQVIH